MVNACLKANGFAADLMNADVDKLAAVYEKNTEESLETGVFGAPAYIVGDEVFWGQDRLVYLDEYLAGL